MGREQELRDAARDGNIVKLENLLSGKKSSIMSSLRKGLNINCQDENGNTALHLAALNGRSEAATLLLQNDASANIPENLGNYPLHLAAFNGHHEVADVLINQGPSRANVLEQNLAGDTALHIAAQYGHTKVVQTLLECHSDAHIRNKKDETPLDLAAMYGRLTTVQVLIWSDRSLVKDSCEIHSPLHLSARNGHTSVIEALLDFGMSANQMCNRGTALHEAALFGKIDAVKILLNKGIDVNAKNDDDNTVLDLLVDLPSERSQEITALIYEQTQAMMSSGQARSKSMSINSSDGSISGRPSRSGEPSDEAKAHYTQVGGTARSASVSQRSTNQGYSLVQYPRHSRHEGGYPQATISPLIEDSSSRDDLFNDRFLRQMQPPSPGFANDIEERQEQSQLSTLSSKQRRTTTMNPYKEHSVPAPNRTDAATNDNATVPSRSSTATYDMVPLPNRSNAGTYDNVLAPGRNSAATYDVVPAPKQSNAATYDMVPAPKNRSSATTYDTVPTPYRSSDATYDNVPAPKLSRESIPSFPPPSSDEALRTLKTYVGLDKLKANDRKENSGPGNEVYENYRIDPKEPMSDFEKLHLRMSPPPPPANDTYDNVNITNNPAKDMKPKTDLISFNDTESDEIQPLPSARYSGVKQQRTRSSVKSASESSGGSRPSSTLNESYEWSKIDKIFSSFEDLIGGADGLGDVLHEAPASIGDWLNNLDLSHYEASFVANGYDDIRYIGGDMLDEDDLREIGIQNPEHIRAILISASELPSPPQIGDDDFPIPESVAEWLTKINLLDYETRFAVNRYDSMDRIRAIWEFELTTVIGIHLSGHRKRMIYSLGHRPEQEREKVSWSKKFKDAEAPRTTQSSGDDPMDLANQLLKTAEEMVQGFENRKDKKEDSPKKTKPESPPKSPTSPKIVKYQPSFEWIHKPETLLYSSVIYPTQYLGSHPVMVVRGTQSTVDACKKMKATSKMLQKVPTISLSISVRGIEFIDAQSNSTISNYDIRYISYCAQDPEDLAIFAYITKDAKTGKHYCHVFKAASLALADEIVLTIGQGFELAYHQHRVLVDEAKERKKGDGNTEVRQAKNQLHEQEKAETQGSGPPPMPKPYAASKQGKGSS